MSTLKNHVNGHGDMRPLLWSLLFGSVALPFSGRHLEIFYFDVLLVLWLLYYVFWKDFWPRFSGSIVGLGVFFLLLGMLSALVNYHDLYKSLAALKVSVCGLLVYTIARKVPPSVLTLSLWGATAAVLLFINYHAIRYGDYDSEIGLKDKVEIALGRSNYIASFLLLLIPLAVAAIFFSKGKMRLVFTGCTVAMFAGLITTMSRGAMLAILLATMLSLPLLYRAGVSIKHAILVLGLAGSAVLFLPSDLLTADAALIAYRFENTDEGRQEAMGASWEAFKQHPLLGVGPGQLGNAMASHMMVPDENQEHTNAHNLVINALAENGLPAGLALLAMVGIVLYRALKTAIFHPTALDVALWVALLAAVIHNMVEPSFEGQQFQVLFWTISGIVEMRHGSSPITMKPST